MGRLIASDQIKGNMDCHAIFKVLSESAPVHLTDLPNSYGLYALWNHEGKIRYIGCTPKNTEGFRDRVTNKHVTGSEGRSHKFSQAYCIGRMWRYCKKLHPPTAEHDQKPEDARKAKKLRNAFIRKYCRATYVEIPNSATIVDYFNYLTSIESQVQSMAPSSMREWEGINFISETEPRLLVDKLLNEKPELREAAERQEKIYLKYISVNA